MDPPFNDIWPIPGEEHHLETWNREDRSRPLNVMTPITTKLQLADFLCAVLEDREPLVDGEAGRRVVELFTGVYRSQLEHASLHYRYRSEPRRFQPWRKRVLAEQIIRTCS